jgi:hypothetical protein
MRLRLISKEIMQSACQKMQDWNEKLLGCGCNFYIFRNKWLKLKGAGYSSISSMCKSFLIRVPGQSQTRPVVGLI